MSYFGSLNENTLPAWARTHVQNMLNMAAQQSARPYQPYPGQRVANVPEDTQQAHRMARETGQDRPYLEQASRYSQNAAQGFRGNEQLYMNPYQQMVTNRIAAEGNRNFNENLMPSLAARFAGLGQFGSSHHAELATRALRDTQNEISNQQARSMHSGYEASNRMFNEDRNRQSNASKEMGVLAHLTQAGRSNDINALNRQGQYLQGQNQEYLNTQYMDHNRQQEDPQQKAASYAANIAGAPMPMSNFSASYTPAPPQWNSAGQVGNAAGNMLAMQRLGNYKKGGYVKISPAVMGYLTMKQLERQQQGA